MQHIKTAAIIILFAVWTCRAAPSNTSAPFPSSTDWLKRAAPVASNLRVFVRYGVGLRDRDGPFAGKSDPYVKVKAHDSSGGLVTKKTRHEQGNHSPVWNSWLNFGTRSNWHHIKISVWDRDIGRDDRLTSSQVFHLTSGHHRYLVHCCTVYFDYILT